MKTHKVPALAHQQLAAGAVGIACQKLGEAEVMARAGITEILVTFPLVGEAKTRRAARLAASVALSVTCDSEVAARSLAAAAQAEGVEIGVLIDCDTGLGRTGVQAPEEAVALADAVAALSGLRLVGLATHPFDPETDRRLVAAVDAVRGRGHAATLVSGGGTPQAFRAHESPVLTEVRVGNYVFGDRRGLLAGTHRLEDCALRVRAMVVSRPTSTRAVLDAGSKTLTSDPVASAAVGGFGLVVEYPEAVVAWLSEEHAVVDLSASADRPVLGEVVTVVPNHACGVVNLHDSLAFHRDGAEVELVEVLARGKVS